MKKIFFLLLLGSAGSALGQGQTGRGIMEISMDIYQRANSPDALKRLNPQLVKAPEAHIERIPVPGTLITADGKRYRVAGLSYNVALQLLEATDSTGSHVWPPGSLQGFELGRGNDARHFQTYKIRDGGVKPDFVELLTLTKSSPIVLAVQHHYVHEEAVLDPVLKTVKVPERTVIGQRVMAGSGNLPNEPLREVQLKQRDVLKLFGGFAPQMSAFAAKENLSYTDLTQVLRMVEYYNQKVAK
ncbi:hypothetical protein Q5H93_22795 [Hymenobacter sp. ASUV-10]|uniref:Uncharacterized protein n=1 Tax=Hymenobacter aranciens TaxID=3063996 RepID=A0ABT9BIF3_9BACT|nr:hypothetical protein [Hymenobacter sp. ASUV-10]MDO7877585.1 hypothetical protein [Hymenobacter sp. ASUV-10]